MMRWCDCVLCWFVSGLLSDIRFLSPFLLAFTMEIMLLSHFMITSQLNAGVLGSTCVVNDGLCWSFSLKVSKQLACIQINSVCY